MTFPIFIDANVPAYAAGAEHPLKQPNVEVLRLVAANSSAFVTSAEVLQELLHRYIALRRWPQARTTFQRFVFLMRGRTELIAADDVVRASELADLRLNLSARDLLHLAIMQRLGADTVVTADRGFDRAPGIQRLDPANVALWRTEVRSSMR